MTAIQLTTNVSINGQTIDVKSWECHLGAYGSINTFLVTTSAADLKLLGINPFNLQNQTPLLPIKIYAGLNGSNQLIFSGIIDSIKLSAHDDLVEIMGRDNSAILRDTSTKLDKSLYFNQPISNIVQQIASQYGFTPVVTTTSQLAGVKYANNVGDEYAFPFRPQPLWNTLQSLAKQTGFLLYVNAKNELHFEQPGSGSGNHQYAWRPLPASTISPIYELEMLKQGRRSHSFTVTVFGYDQVAKQAVQATTTVNGGNGPTYYKRFPNLAVQDAQGKADAAAADIARKGLIITMMVDGDPTLQVSDMISIQEVDSGDLFGLQNQPMYISGITHSFVMPGYESIESEGFFSHITAALAITSGDE